MNASRPVLRSEAEIRQWILETLTRQMKLDPHELDPDLPIEDQGIDSMQFVVFVGLLEEWLGVQFAHNPLSDYPSVSSLAGFLAAQLALGKSVIRADE